MPHRRRFGDNLSLAAKGLLLVAVPVVAQIAILLALRSVQMALSEAEESASHSREVLQQAEEIHSVAIQAVASQRAALMMGDPDYHEAPDEGLVERIDILSREIVDNPAQVERLGEIRRNAISLDAWLQEQRGLLRQGRQKQAVERVSERRGATRLALLRRNLDEFLEAEEQLSLQRSARLSTVTRQAQGLTALAAAVSLIVAVVLAYFFSRGISRRFAVVTQNAERLAAGESLPQTLFGSDEIARLDVVLHDSSRRLAEAAALAARSRRELEQHVQELAALNHELNQQTDENETFIYSVSHDLRSPLVNLQGFSKELAMACTELETLVEDRTVPEELRTRMERIVDREIRESVYYIRTAVTRAGGIIDSLLRLARVGRVELRWQRVLVRQIVRNVVDAMRASIDAKGAQVVVHPLDDAWGDATAVEQVFANLVGNSVNYLDPARRGRIEIGMLESTDPSFRTYYVRDNGLGIPETGLPKVFTAFQRHHARHADGEGVGLALVRRIVDRHRGRIWVESTEGEGTTFFVELPAGPPPHGLMTPEHSRSQHEGGDGDAVTDVRATSAPAPAQE
jgi:signal transduction histidine kinase